MQDYTLVVLAAGLGSRFGGLKQIEPIGPNGEFIIDYSIYDAIQAGFTKVVFVIKKENEQIFKETIDMRLNGKIKIEYAFQSLDDLPEGYSCPKERTKPWGTGHALYSARHLINGPFAVINADDLYGPEAYQVLMDFLKNNKEFNHYVSIGYAVENTLSAFGTVKRGINKTENGILKEIIESQVGKQNGVIVAKPLDGRPAFTISDQDTASVNMFGFTEKFMEATINRFSEFLNNHIDDLNAEYLMTNDIISKEINDNKAIMYVKKTTAKWGGVTYKEDKENVVKQINDHIKDGTYPTKL